MITIVHKSVISMIINHVIFCDLYYVSVVAEDCVISNTLLCVIWHMKQICTTYLHFWFDLNFSGHYITTFRAAIAAYMTIIATLFYYSTFYYITTPTTNRLTLLRIGLLTDITTFRAAIAAKILTWITTFYYYTTLVM